jgi:transcription antitermination factor NusG
MESKHWYVLRAIFKQELKVRDYLRSHGFRCYVPMSWQVKDVRGRRERRLIPAITELVFVYGDEKELSECKSRCRETVYWLMTQRNGRSEKLIVGNKAMDDFISVTEQSEREVTYFRPDEISLVKGDRIRIHGGAFDGVEGVLMKVKGKREKQLMVSIPDLAVAAVSVKPDVVEVVSQQCESSHNILGDAKELIRLSTTMLTSPPDKETSRHEWDLLYYEIQALYQSLLPRKGYIAATEAQLSLSLLLAERFLGSVTESTLQRCHNAASRLRPSKLREQLLDEIKKNTL